MALPHPNPRQDLDAPDDPDDATLLERLRHGDTEAYGTLYERHAPAARRFAWRLASSGATADDLVADAFAAILAAIGRGHGPTDGFQAYLFTAVRRHAQRHWGRNVAVPGGLDPTALVRQTGGFEADDGPDEVALAALDQLPPRWQGALRMIELEGRPIAEVADSLGLSPNATSALAYRARRALRESYLAAVENLPAEAGGAVQISPRRRATSTASAREVTPSFR